MAQARGERYLEPMQDHPLERAVWHALTTRQADLALGGALARRIREDIGPFAALRDASAEAIEALGALTHSDDDLSLLEPAPPAPPPGVTLKMSAPGVQMVAGKLAASGKSFVIEALSANDAPEMLELALLTKPGPFRAQTHTLGRFVGVRDKGRLVAMAGERLKLPGFTEVSGVCTHPDYRGHGFAAALTIAVADRLQREGETPFLHAYASNVGAIELYKRLGFELRCNVVHAMWTRDE